MNQKRLGELLESYRCGWSLPQSFYTDPWIFQQDLKRIFFRYWLFAGHTSQVPNAGDYVTYEIGDESIIISRGADETIHAFFNVCRHRGSRICLEPAGHAKSLVCPYHQWVYKSDGSLAAARLMPADFDKTQFGLHRAHVRVVEGLIFINLAQEPVEFESFESDLKRYLTPHGLGRAKIAHTRHYDVRANWKLVFENSRECYHCAKGHPEYCRAMLSDEVSSIGAAPQDEDYTNERKAEWRKLGLETTDVNPDFPADVWYKLQRYPVRRGLLTQSLDGQPVAPRMGDLPGRDTGVLSLVTRPQLMFQANSDHVAVTRMTPMGPQLTRVTIDWLVHEDAVENVDYEIDRLTSLWRITSEQDFELCENNQLGVNSSRYEPGRYAPDEIGVDRFVQWYVNQHVGLIPIADQK